MNNDVFDLCYVRKSDNKIFHARKIIHGVYKIKDPMMPGEAETVSKYRLGKDFRFQERVSMANVREKTAPTVRLKMA